METIIINVNPDYTIHDIHTLPLTCAFPCAQQSSTAGIAENVLDSSRKQQSGTNERTFVAR